MATRAEELARRAKQRGTLEEVESGTTPGTNYFRSTTAKETDATRTGRTIEPGTSAGDVQRLLPSDPTAPQGSAVTPPPPSGTPSLPTAGGLPQTGVGAGSELTGISNLDKAKLSSPTSLMAAVKDRLAQERERNLDPLRDQRAKTSEDLATLGTKSLGRTQGFDINSVREAENIQRQVMRSKIGDLDRRIDDRQKTIDDNIANLSNASADVFQSLVAQQQQDFENRAKLRTLDMQEEQFEMQQEKMKLDRMTTLADIQMSLPKGTKLSELGFTGEEGDREGMVEPIATSSDGIEVYPQGSTPTSDTSGMANLGSDVPNADNCVLYARTQNPRLPTGLFTKENKQQAIQASGQPVDENIQVGDTILTGEGKWGHAAQVMGIEGGQLILDEANYVSGKHTKGRRIDMKDPSIYGYVSSVRDETKPGFVSDLGVSAPEGQPNEGVYEGVDTYTSEAALSGNVGPDGGQDQNNYQGYYKEAIAEGVPEDEARKLAYKRLETSYGKLSETEAKSYVAYGIMDRENPQYDKILDQTNFEDFTNSVNVLTRGIKGDGLSAEIINRSIDDPVIRQALYSEMRWIEGFLRKQSGAAIKEEEYAFYGTMFFPRAGDDPASVMQKKASRQSSTQDVFTSMGSSGQRQYEENSAGSNDPLGLGI